MADISMCMQKDCEHKAYCYRQTATANPYRQSYMAFDFKKDPTCLWDTRPKEDVSRVKSQGNS